MTAKIVPFEFGGSTHSLVKCPNKLPPDSGQTGPNPNNLYNILMADVSGSMYSFWKPLVKGWNSIVQPELIGNSVVYAYGDVVELLRKNSAELKQEDFKSTGTEDLTNALRTVMEEINSCKETYIRAFIISDGAHCLPGEQPDIVIQNMKPPEGKTVEVYMLGVGMSFPVEYSINIRSRLHNGPTNIPYIFWPKEPKDIDEQMQMIVNELEGGNIKLNLSISGQHLPYSSNISEVYLGDWIYFSKSPEDMKELKIYLDNDYIINIESSDITYDELTREVFSQWNTLILQKHRTGAEFDKNVFNIMQEAFNTMKEKLISKLEDPGDSMVAKRLLQKKIKQFDIDFATILNSSKSLIETRDKFSSEIELAETLIKTTSASKYETKSLKLKGHSNENYLEDIEEFRNVYNRLKPKIMEIPPPDPDDCCRITASSTISDLQDSEFEMLLDCNKFEFLKTFNLTGIPIYSTLKDSTVLNPWTIQIKNILINPFEVLSQVALEFGAETGEMSDDKGILLKKSDENTRFNAVIPVFPKDTVNILKPLLQTKLYAMCSTFAILKSVHILDFECHVAALACVWLNTIHNYSKDKRPEFIMKRIQSIEETTKIYSERKGLINFAKCLQNTPKVALVTNSGETRCESLTKPTFLLHIYHDILNISSDQLTNILPLLLCEFIGRCLSPSCSNKATPFTDVLMKELKKTEDKMKWYETLSPNVIDAFLQTGETVLKKFYSPGYMLKNVTQNLQDNLAPILESNIQIMDIQFDKKKLENLKHSGNCGDITWCQLKSWAHEMDIDENIIDKYFSADMILVYVSHSIKNRSSKDRMSKDLGSSSNVKEEILKEIIKENKSGLKKFVSLKIKEELEKRWLKEYESAHASIISPMTKHQVIENAVKQGINVDESNFEKMYKHREKVGILRNACMSSKCPHFMIPHKDFNEHISIERKRNSFPHNLHNVTSINYKEDISIIFDQIYSKKTPKRAQKSIQLLSNDEFTEVLSKNMPILVSEYVAFNMPV